MSAVNVTFHPVGDGHQLALQTIGNPDGIKILMVHGGPGYYWITDNLLTLHQRLRDAGHDVCLQALSCRGCGIGEATSRFEDLLNDDLVKRAQDLLRFETPDILLGHSTGAMIVLAAVIEEYCQPREVLLVSPYTASLGEQAYWVSTKAEKYPRAFATFHDFVAEQWQLNKGPLPHNFRQHLYEHWGELYFHLHDRDLQLKMQLVYGNFHVIDALPHMGVQDGEPYIIHHSLLQKWPNLPDNVKDTLWRTATINANWWRSNYQNGYPFIDAVKTHDFTLPIHILSGMSDEITPPASVRKLGEILNVTPQLVENCGHLAEANVQGHLDIALADSLSGMCARLHTQG